jgi:hypothetical protein
MITEIIDENFKKQIIFLLNNHWTGKHELYFPAQNSINIEKKHLFKLFNFRYLYYIKNTVSTKRSVLFLFKDVSGNNTAVLIFKDLSVYSIKLETMDEYYCGSIFEVSFSHKTNDIVIYDSFLISGNKINYHPFEERISEAGFMISNLIKSECKITLVKFSDKIVDFKELEKDEELFIIPNDIPILTGINFSFFKWKPAEKITFNLHVMEKEKDLILMSSNFRKLTDFAKICNNNDNGKEYINNIKNLDNYKNNCILEINIKFPEGKIIIEKVNDEKIYPTSIRLIEKILFIKRENIKFEELF